jgi:NAD(P)-dependent dehydrogenase (short-subunit alcohol dehydrogenase family)
VQDTDLRHAGELSLHRLLVVVQELVATSAQVGFSLLSCNQRQLEDKAKEEGTDVETQKRRLLTEKQAMAEFSTPEQIGALAVFLCSEGARTIPGAPLPIDGGWVAQWPRRHKGTTITCAA